MRQEASPWTAKLSSMFNAKTLIFLGVGVVIGYLIYKRMNKGGQSAAAPGGAPSIHPMMMMPGYAAAASHSVQMPNIKMPTPNYNPMRGMGDVNGGFENLGHYAPGQEACAEADHIYAPSTEFEIQ